MGVHLASRLETCVCDQDVPTLFKIFGASSSMFSLTIHVSFGMVHAHDVSGSIPHIPSGKLVAYVGRNVIACKVFLVDLAEQIGYVPAWPGPNSLVS